MAPLLICSDCRVENVITTATWSLRSLSYSREVLYRTCWQAVSASYDREEELENSIISGRIRPSTRRVSTSQQRCEPIPFSYKPRITEQAPPLKYTCTYRYATRNTQVAQLPSASQRGPRLTLAGRGCSCCSSVVPAAAPATSSVVSRSLTQADSERL
jgi:hypothetical protein